MAARAMAAKASAGLLSETRVGVEEPMAMAGRNDQYRPSQRVGRPSSAHVWL